MASQVLKNSTLRDHVFFPDHGKYQESLESYWSLQESELKPSAVFMPDSAAALAQAVKLLHDANVKTGFAAPFAVRAGGRHAYPGSANIGPSGLTIDLRRLNQLSLSGDRASVVVGAGNTFEQVYNYLDPLNLNVPGARVAQVGVSGFTLGGGLSYYSAKDGFVCDNIDDYEIVIADGSLVHANATDHPDLWKALKGGGNNFGIVTAFTMRTIPKKDMWGGALINDPSVFPQSAEWLHKQVASPSFDGNAAIFIGLAELKGFRMAYHSLKYTEPTPNPPVFKGFTDLPASQNTMRQASLTELAIEEGKFSLPGARRLYMTCSFKCNLQMLLDADKMWNDSVKSVSHLAGLEWTFIVHPIVPAAMHEGDKRGGNSLGLTGNETILVFLLVGTWDKSADDAEAERRGANFIDSICARSKELGVFHPYIYMNYAWKGQRVMDGYGPDVKKQLQAASRKYDPDGIFQKAVPGGFKLFD